ncbi:diacylglycerol/lipid kinase family protein [Streptomyces roseicoloratus]|uniref:diacylglycerol/lipid kinase family protein n=1 Tax=Streptomyces roseicoloratus TaxID=2508722 RepID=UPI0010098A51|nr:diacylglycerol kinase family protein [Streptomyces roseicoloratus]
MSTEDRDHVRRRSRARLLARCALLAAVLAVVSLFVPFGSGGLLIVASGLAGLALCAAGVWWFLAHRGPVRLLGALLAAATPAAVLLLYVDRGLWRSALTSLLLWGVALFCARSALRRPERRRRARPAPRPRRPVIVMNPKSGDGKVGRFGLVEKAERLGAKVVLLEPADHGEEPADVTELARAAVAEGADLLGVAGGDGTQALVAAVAAEHDLPFLVISAGTRNHLAMDLGLDRTDPSRCLDALTDGEELRIDLGDVGGRPFVNTVSFGVYADVVQHPEYRDAKAGTALSMMPDLLGGEAGRRVDARADGAALSDQQALLVSNNAYNSPDPFGGGRRPRLDGGLLGVVAVRVEGAAQAAELAVRGAQSAGLNVLTAHRVEVTAGTDTLPVAVDGEALTLPAPVVCTIRPRALRVLVPRDRPGTVPAAPPTNWNRILVLAVGRRIPRGGSHG